MNDDETETIAMAIKSIEKIINRILQRRDHNPNDKSRLRIHRLVEHTRHVLIELFNKRRSLKAFLRWFQKEWIRIEVDLEKYPVEILQHAMQHFLRCQDAFILLTSGECRHEYDTKLAKTTKFRSRLSTLQERDDGYTVLYKDTGVYSGYGFDEFNNEIVGIRALLVKELKRYHKSPWDYLERQGGTELLESLLDQHECEAKELQHSLQSLKRKMIENINKRLKPKNLKFATQDKMERLCLSIQGQRIDLERRADSFQIEGPLLPDENKIPEDWNSCALEFKKEKKGFIIPPSKKQKRRRVIVDSDSEDEISDTGKSNDTKSNSNSEQSAGKSSGLVVRVDSSHTNIEKEDSLAVIKTQMGVNTHDLEQAREILEEEDTNTNRVFEEEKVVCLEKNLKRVLTRDEIDENEVWDARECLRYACMEAGNKYLWDSRIGCVDRAIENFERAKQIVEMQQKSQQKLPGLADRSVSESSLFVQLNLLYLHGQAIVNIGISLVDTSQRKISTPKVKILRAIEEFKTVQVLMAKLRGLAEKARQSSTSTNRRTTEATSYILKSEQLESLTCRWMGRGLWLISQEKKSIAAFEQASHIFNEGNLEKWQDNAYFEDDFLDLAAEAIYATCDLADRCYSKMEEFNDQSSSSSSRKKGDELLDVVTRALNRHTGISETIERFYCPVRAKHFRVENDISPTQDVILYRDEIIKWWKERSKNQTTNVPLITSRHGLPFKRSDLSSSTTNVMLTSEQPSTNSIFSSDGGKRKRYQKHQKGSSGAHGLSGNNSQRPTTNRDAVYALSSEGLYQQPRQPIKYRKWGDELLAEQHAQKQNRGDLSKEVRSSCLLLAYPSIAPPMPMEYQVS